MNNEEIRKAFEAKYQGLMQFVSWDNGEGRYIAFDERDYRAESEADDLLTCWTMSFEHQQKRIDDLESENKKWVEKLAYCYDSTRIVYKGAYLDGGQGYTAFKYAKEAVEALKEAK